MAPGHGGARRAGSTDGAGSQLRHRRTTRDGRAHDWAPRRHGSSSRHTTRRRPNREPFSSVDVYIRRGTAERDVGVRRRVSDNRQDSNHRRLARAPRGALRGPTSPVSPATLQGAPSAEAPRRAPPCPGAPDREHARREPFSGGAVVTPPRPQKPRVALRRAPCRPIASTPVASRSPVLELTSDPVRFSGDLVSPYE
jgi:hypothetical protein